ncbi:hypothetical protein [Azospirillum argentinense]
MVSLSSEAQKAMAGAVSLSTPDSKSDASSGKPDLSGFEAIVAAKTQLAKEESAYASKLDSIVRSTFDVPKDSAWMVSGAGFAVLNKLAASHDLQRPKIPQILADAGVKDFSAEEMDSKGGVIGFTVTAAHAANRGSHMEVVFDRTSAVAPDQMRLLALKKDDPSNQSLLNKMQGGELSRFIDTTADLQAGSGTSLFMVTDNASGEKARIAGVIRSTGLDDVAPSSGLAVLKRITELMS